MQYEFTLNALHIQITAQAQTLFAKILGNSSPNIDLYYDPIYNAFGHLLMHTKTQHIISSLLYTIEDAHNQSFTSILQFRESSLHKKIMQLLQPYSFLMSEHETTPLIFSLLSHLHMLSRNKDAFIVPPSLLRINPITYKEMLALLHSSLKDLYS